MKTSYLLATAASACLTAVHAQSVFTDNFDAGPSPLWSNSRGAWGVSNGVYSATFPENVPPTFTGLPFALENFALDVDINQVADGGVWLRCDADGTNGVLLVTGGHGWGSGARGGNAGRSLYWHVITPQNWSSPPILNEAFNVFANPGVENVHLRIEVLGNLYSAFLNGSTSATTSLLETNATYHSGHVGLYDFSSQNFDNVMLEIPPGFGPYRINIGQVDSSQVTLFWTTNAVGWVLQEALSLSAPTWTNSPSGSTNPVVVPAAFPAKFYRLHKP